MNFDKKTDSVDGDWVLERVDYCPQTTFGGRKDERFTFITRTTASSRGNTRRARYPSKMTLVNPGQLP